MISNVVAVLGALALVSGIQSYTLPSSSQVLCFTQILKLLSFSEPVVKPNYWFSFGDSYTSTVSNLLPVNMHYLFLIQIIAEL